MRVLQQGKGAPRSELEVDEGLHPGAQGLPGEGDGEHGGDDLDGEGEALEAGTVAGFPALREEVDGVAQRNDGEDRGVAGDDGGPGGAGPAVEELGEHRVGGEPFLPEGVARAERFPRGLAPRPEPDARERDEVKRQEDPRNEQGRAVGPGGRAQAGPDFGPPDPEPIQAAPEDEVPAGAVPEAADEHGEEGVGLAYESGPPIGQSPEHPREQGHSPQRHQPRRRARQHEQDEAQRDGGHEPGEARPAAVAAHGDIEVIPQPGRQADVPPLPEIARVARLVRRSEVHRQLEAHPQGDADGHIRIAAEVRVHLQA
ncbi:MAG: hypothetical protein RJA19_1677, partial [Bacteroidota bacterium]